MSSASFVVVGVLAVIGAFGCDRAAPRPRAPDADAAVARASMDPWSACSP
jgi:hypothetical protein